MVELLVILAALLIGGVISRAFDESNHVTNMKMHIKYLQGQLDDKKEVLFKRNARIFILQTTIENLKKKIEESKK